MFSHGWRLISSLVLTLAFLIDPVFGKAPLPPGKPAGVRTAQVNTEGVFLIGTALVILVGGLIAVAHPYQLSGQSSTPSTSP